MSDVFFEELMIPRPDYHLSVGSGSHGKQTGDILMRVEEILFLEKPDLVIVYGDTNTTIGGALAAAKLNIPVAHVEAGLRSYDRTMPEEINRVVTDHISNLLFCPTENAVRILAKEGIERGVHLVGDVMVDALEFNKEIAEKRSQILERLCITPNQYLVLTVHRPANTDRKENLESIIRAVEKAGMPVVFPVHPRTKKCLQEYGMWNQLPANIIITEPLGYLDMVKILRHASKILTDSGGMQKEAYMLGVPCITLRENTEWVETVEEGWNVLAGADFDKILNAIMCFNPDKKSNNIFGRFAAKKIVNMLDI
jgi:UDP-GlcNAc3NAcA epimerase